MKDALMWFGILIVSATGLGSVLLVWRRENRALQVRQVALATEHEAQTIELARQRHLRELEELRRGLLRGRDRSCRFCGLEQGALTLDDVCMDVEPCLARVPTSTAGGLTN